jgi:hypothetical protein
MAEHTKEMSMTAETSNARSEWPARYMANGPQGTFYTDDLKLADALLRAYDEDDDWTVTEMPDPSGTLAAPQPPSAPVGVEGRYHPCTHILIGGLKRLEGGMGRTPRRAIARKPSPSQGWRWHTLA